MKKKLIRGLKLFALICLIILAIFGIGISGGVPIPFSGSRKDGEDIKIELIEDRDEETDVKEFEAID